MRGHVCSSSRLGPRHRRTSKPRSRSSAVAGPSPAALASIRTRGGGSLRRPARHPGVRRDLNHESGLVDGLDQRAPNGPQRLDHGEVVAAD